MVRCVIVFVLLPTPTIPLSWQCEPILRELRKNAEIALKNALLINLEQQKQSLLLPPHDTLTEIFFHF